MVKDFHLPRLITLGHCLKKLCFYLLHGGQQPSASLLVLYVYTFSKCCIYRTFHRSLSFTILLCMNHMNRRSGPAPTISTIHFDINFVCWGRSELPERGNLESGIEPKLLDPLQSHISKQEHHKSNQDQLQQYESTQKIYHKYIKTNTNILGKDVFFALSLSPNDINDHPRRSSGSPWWRSASPRRSRWPVPVVPKAWPRSRRRSLHGGSGIWDVWYTKI